MTRAVSSREKGPDTPGGGIGRPSCSEAASKARPSHGLRSLAAQTARPSRPPGTSTRRNCWTARVGIGGELPAVPAQHDIEAGVGLVDLLEVEDPRGDAGQAQLDRPPRGHLDHRGRGVGQHDLAARDDLRGGRETQPAGPAGQLEHPIARPRDRRREEPVW